jgi:RNA polymerase sigma-70 factor (ECF subfamily)
MNTIRHRARRPIEVELTPAHEPVIADFASVVADRELLDLALRRLDPEWRAVVVLHYYLGLSLPNVAATLGIPVGTAKSRLHRSLASMRVAIGSDWDSGMSTAEGGQYA